MSLMTNRLKPARLVFSRFLILMIAGALITIAHAGLADAAQHKPKAAISKKKAAPQTMKKAMWGPPEINGTSQFPTYRDLGVGIYQMAVAWNDIAPTKPSEPTNPGDPAYVWPAHLDSTIAEAKSYGMKVMLMVVGAPSWANGGNSDRAFAPRDPADYANFMKAISARYPGINMWMIWGEPNRQPNFRPLTPSRTGPLNAEQASAPRLYGRILDEAYKAIKSVNKKDLVIGGNTYTAAGKDSISTYQWLRYMKLPNGRMPRMDLWGHNPFTFRIPKLRSRPSPKGRVDFSDLKRLTKKLDRYYPGKKKLKLFLSEFGIPGGGSKDAELGFGLSLKTQVKWIKAAFKYQKSLKRIYTLGWVHPFDRPDFGITTGLLTADGKRKPGYFAFRAG